MKKYWPSLVHITLVLSFPLLLWGGSMLAGTPQEQVHQMAHKVMPFDISETVHLFKITEFGGIQQVIAKESDSSEQIALIQQHLQHEAGKFQLGDYSDPGKLHGTQMPGLEELQAGASDGEVSYKPLPTGAELSFKTTAIRLLTAIHRWFGAQLSEHGADAKTE